MMPHSINMDTVERTVIVSISTTAVQTANTRRRNTRRRQFVQTQWKRKTKIKIGSKDYDNLNQGRKSKEINIVNNLNQVSKKSALENSTVENTAFFDKAASLHLVHEQAPTEKIFHNNNKKPSPSRTDNQ